MRADVNERWPTPVVGFSRPQAASISFVDPSAVSRAALAAKQQSRMIKTRGIAFSSKCCRDDHAKVGLSCRLVLQEFSQYLIGESQEAEPAFPQPATMSLGIVHNRQFSSVGEDVYVRCPDAFTSPGGLTVSTIIYYKKL